MCCFGTGSRNTPLKVADTRIFGRRDGQLQLLVYSMQLSVEEPVAMILPLPVAHDAGEDALRFVSLDRCPDFFDALELVFNPPPDEAALTIGGDAEARPTLRVHTVGSFDASYVPSIADFSRLDPRFRLPEGVWADLPHYEDYGFAVFKLNAGAGQKIHPMAFWFPTRDHHRLFFPTLHVHDGQVHRSASFDHVLFYQRDLPELRTLVAHEPKYVAKPGSYDETVEAMKEHGRAHGRWWRRFQVLELSLGDRVSRRTAAGSLGHCAEMRGRVVEDRETLARLTGLVREDWHLFCREVQGESPNIDTWIADSSTVIKAPAPGA